MDKNIYQISEQIVQLHQKAFDLDIFSALKSDYLTVVFFLQFIVSSIRDDSSSPDINALTFFGFLISPQKVVTRFIEYSDFKYRLILHLIPFLCSSFLYSFEDGERFEPDYVLLLQRKKTGRFEQIQILWLQRVRYRMGVQRSIEQKEDDGNRIGGIGWIALEYTTIL